MYRRRGTVFTSYGTSISSSTSQVISQKGHQPALSRQKMTKEALPGLKEAVGGRPGRRSDLTPRRERECVPGPGGREEGRAAGKTHFRRKECLQRARASTQSAKELGSSTHSDLCSRRFQNPARAGGDPVLLPHPSLGPVFFLSVAGARSICRARPKPWTSSSHSQQKTGTRKNFPTQRSLTTLGTGRDWRAFERKNLPNLKRAILAPPQRGQRISTSGTSREASAPDGPAKRVRHDRACRPPPRRPAAANRARLEAALP